MAGGEGVGRPDVEHGRSVRGRQRRERLGRADERLIASLPRDRATPPRTHRSRERTRGEAGPGNEPDERTERVDTRCAEEMQAGHGRFESVIEHRGAFRAPDVREQARREEPIAVDVYPVPRREQNVVDLACRTVVEGEREMTVRTRCLRHPPAGCDPKVRGARSEPQRRTRGE